MNEQRRALHDQVEQVSEEEIDRLVGLINRFLHPLASPAPPRIVFKPVSPGSKAAAEIEEQRQQALARLRAERSEMITRSIGETVTRLGIDLSKIGEGPCGWQASGAKPEYFTCNWFEGRVFNRVSTFHLKERQVVTFERCHLSETQPELIYKVRVLTAAGDVEKELTVPI